MMPDPLRHYFGFQIKRYMDESREELRRVDNEFLMELIPIRNNIIINAKTAEERRLATFFIELFDEMENNIRSLDEEEPFRPPRFEPPDPMPRTEEEEPEEDEKPPTDGDDED